MACRQWNGNPLIYHYNIAAVTSGTNTNDRINFQIKVYETNGYKVWASCHIRKTGTLFTQLVDVLPVISWSFKTASYNDRIVLKLTGISAALLPWCRSIFRAIGAILTRISLLRDFARSCDKTSVRLVIETQSPVTSFSGADVAWYHIICLGSIRS